MNPHYKLVPVQYQMTEWQNVWIQITAFLCHDIALISINLISSTLKQTKVIKCCTYLKQNQRRNFVPKIFVWLCLSVCQSLNYSAFQLASSDVTGCGHIIHVCSCDPRSVWRLFSVIVIQSCNFKHRLGMYQKSSFFKKGNTLNYCQSWHYHVFFVWYL